jgi:hypothetical protein
MVMWIINRNVLRWYGHVEKVDKRVYRAQLEGSRGRRRPKLRRVDGVKAAVEQKGTNIEYAIMCMQKHDRWRRVVYS